MVQWNEGPCGFDGGLKLKNSLKTELWSYLYNWNFCTGKMASYIESLDGP